MSLAEAPSLKSGQMYSPSKSLSDSAGYGDSTAPRTADAAGPESRTDDGRKNGKSKKRSLFGFGKKKAETSFRSASSAEPPSLSRDASRLSSTSQATSSPTQITNATAATTQSEPGPFVIPSSPTRALSTSPRVSSPAGSQIFERDVQDSTVLKPSSPAIPTHIQTENYIPPVLDDASEAITNEKLNPDAVEIVTHTLHQPASTSSEWAAELASFADRVGLPPPDNASNYGSLDSADVRRLSFISFADVVQAEHTGHAGTAESRDSIHLAGLTSIPSAALNRSPSPIRSPVSSQGPGTSPPTSNPGSMKGVDLSPLRKPVTSPSSGGQLNLTAPTNDLNIETMRQALRRTGSSDLSNVRSMPTSPIEGPVSR
ncbi:uncharacterized protein HRG_10756 [Hirsutella rhossiliensis]|uniref:Uncharacterized protein n=1 Tax=Hirsutella rhossiliensis TaxID=111463 RepID=A0A9P8MPZ6_9HYPO|nr:uncharacterized protein HRG_10756 [Hirsutella rhossiliensis]KAH0958061.1 hypothetical protein HRG_10756 [Hirsutella rhossiliensis]